MIGRARMGTDPERDDLVARISAIHVRHERGTATQEDVGYLLDTIARLPHGVAVTTITLRGDTSNG